MPSGSTEKLHYHTYAQLFFYILKGTATFEIDEKSYEVTENQGIHIPPMRKHKVLNKTNTQLEFIVTSQPKSHGDRVHINE